jgi:hypothetical protein
MWALGLAQAFSAVETTALYFDSDAFQITVFQINPGLAFQILSDSPVFQFHVMELC